MNHQTDGKLTKDLIEENDKKSELGTDDTILRHDSILSNRNNLGSFGSKTKPADCEPRTKNPATLILIKAGTIFVSMILFFILKGQAIMRGVNPDPTCMLDYPIEYYSNGNDIINDPKNPFLRDFLMIMSSFVIDVAFVTMCVLW